MFFNKSPVRVSNNKKYFDFIIIIIVITNTK